MTYAYPSEIFQLVAAIMGVVFTCWALWDAFCDYQAVLESGLNGDRKDIAQSNIEQEALRVLICLLLVVWGVISVLNPPPNPPESEFPELERIVETGRYLVSAVTAIVMVKSALDRRDRRRLLNHLGR